MHSIYDFSARRIDGSEQSLRDYQGQVLLIVNVASRCGFTSQYAGLEALYRQHHEAGFSILGFPCDQFGHQEPGTDDEILDFCTQHYEITFPMYSKIEVNGPGAHPLYRWLKAQHPGVLGTQGIKWNFTKFLINRQGLVTQRYAPTHTPASLENDITHSLATACSRDT